MLEISHKQIMEMSPATGGRILTEKERLRCSNDRFLSTKLIQHTFDMNACFLFKNFCEFLINEFECQIEQIHRVITYDTGPTFSSFMLHGIDIRNKTDNPCDSTATKTTQ